MKIDKQNGNVCFNEQDHAYFKADNPDERFISVTTLIHRFTQPFDKDFWSAYKALERLLSKESWAAEKKSLLNTKKFNKSVLEVYDISENDFNREQQSILDAWDEENRKSCERGTAIHAELENSFYKAGKNVSLQKFGIGGKFECRKDYSDLDIEYGVYPEYLISVESNDRTIRLAGQIDLIVKSGNEITICDWKGLPLNTPIATENGFKTMEELKVGDKVFDKDGNLCNVTVKSSVHNNPCYKINFDNEESIIADCDHRWLVSFSTSKSSKWRGEWREQIMTTKEIATYINSLGDKRQAYDIPKIRNCSPLNCTHKSLPIDPYVLGCWLGNGSKSCGIINNETNNIWEEIKSRGYEIDPDLNGEDRCETRIVHGLRSGLRILNLVNNKHIPDLYLRASYEQRLDLLRGLMDTNGYYHPKRKQFVMETNQEQQMVDLVKLLGTLGVKPFVFDQVIKLNGKEYPGWSVNFSTINLNPFLLRNQEIECPKKDKCSFRIIESVESCDMVPTQCIQVDSPSHTYLAGYSCIVTHNTNKKIDQKSGFNTVTKSTAKMKYPLNALDDSNYWHYSMQLSTYAWMLQKINPNFTIKDLILVHFDHNGNQTIYHCDYLKKEVERMLSFYRKEVITEHQRSLRKRIEY